MQQLQFLSKCYFLDALASLELVMTLTNPQFFVRYCHRGIGSTGQKDNRITGLQPYNLTTLQLYNLKTLKPYNPSTLQPHNLTTL